VPAPKDDGQKVKPPEKQVEKQVEKQADKAPAADKSTSQQLKDAIKKDSLKTATMATSKLLEDAAKQAAKDAKTYNEKTTSTVLAGGVDKTVKVDGKTTTEVTTIAQIKTDGKTESYSSDLGSGASASKKIAGELGYQNQVTHDLGNGNSMTVADKAYGSLSGEAKAKFGITKTSVDAEAGIKGEARLELRHTEVSKIGIVQTTTTTYVEGHAEAGAKAGFHLGYDGVKAEVGVSAGASIAAGTGGELKIGDAKAVGDLKVFAQAQAEAKASAEVTFDPFKGSVKAKGELNAMVSAGVGLDGKAGLFNGDSGGGVGLGFGVSAGTAGVKFKPALDVKDGKLDLKIEFGAGLGLGANGSLQVKGDLNKAKDNLVASTKIGLPPQLTAFATIYGFFS
jgi:hypothetical protein